MIRRFFLLFLTLLIFYPFAFSQEKTSLVLSEIMKGENYVGYSPEDLKWSEDSKTVYFTWNPDQELLRSLYKINIKGMEPVKVMAEEQKDLPTPQGDYSRDFNRKIYEKNGDIFLLNVRSGQIQPITNTLENERDPVFTADEKNIIYRKGDNLYSWTMQGGYTTQLTHFTNEKPEKEEKLSNREKWL